MGSLTKLAPAMNWRIAAALACVALAASPGLAAHRHGPHAGEHAATAPDHTRNAAGATVPAPSVTPGMGGPAKLEPVHVESTAFGGPRNNLGLGSGAGAHPPPVHIATPPASPKPPVIGINGTTLHTSGTGIGGPAKDHSAIAGSSYKHK
jgi:hypothetical protein